MATSNTNLMKKLRNRDYRQGYVDAIIGDTISAQLYNLRMDRGWSQTEIAKRAGMKQERISVLENADYDSYSIKTLKRFAHAFDVALLVKFCPFDELVEFANNFTSTSLHIPPFSEVPYSFQNIKKGSFPEASLQTGFQNMQGTSMNRGLEEGWKSYNIRLENALESSLPVDEKVSTIQIS